MHIVLDAMGSDDHPLPEIHAAYQASEELGIKISLVGQEEKLEPLMVEKGPTKRVKLVHAPEVLEMTDKPARNARRKSDNSMAVGLDMVKSGEAQAFVTAGNTGGAMVNALFRLGRIQGVKRPALTTLLPTKNGHTVLADIGANADCKPLFLLQFGIMGSLYAEQILGFDQPRVGLLSNGEEEGKGNQLIKDTFPLFKDSELNFIGNVEPKELYGGEVEVVVTDGFSGNILIKTSEAVAELLLDILKEELRGSLRTKLGAALAMPAFHQVKALMDPRQIGAAPLLGVNGLVFVAHGRSDDVALVNAIKRAHQSADSDLLTTMKSAIQAQLNTKVVETSK